MIRSTDTNLSACGA